MRSIQKNILPLRFSIKTLNCDVVVLTESWLNESLDAGPILGDLCCQYSYIRCDRTRKRGGGVLMLIRLPIAFETIWSESLADGFELLCCDLKLLQSTLRLIAVYRTPTASINSTIQMIKAISDLCSCKAQCVIMGDFNLPDIDWSKSYPSSVNMASKLFVEMCTSCKLHQKVSKPTRYDSLLDLILTSHLHLVKDIEILPPIGSSDHSCIYFRIQCFIKKPTFRLRRSFHKANYDAICQFLLSLDWRTLLEGHPSVDDKYELFLSILHKCIEEFVPIERHPMNYGKLPPNLVRLFEQRQMRWMNYQIHPTVNNLNSFKALSDKFDRLLNRYHKYVERKILEKPGKSSLYTLLNSVLKRPERIPTLKDLTGQSAVTDESKASMLAKYFHKSYSESSSYSDAFDTVSSTQSMESTIWFHKEEIYNALCALPATFTVTPDYVPPYFIRKIAIAISYPLEHIFNASFMLGEVPGRWKHAFVTPIPKKAPYNLVTSYRPISITSVFARVFERKLKAPLVNYLESNSLIPNNQHGFRSGRSTETLMLSALNDWTKALDQKINVDVVYFDFMKAFDKVPLSKLIYQLEKIGVHPRIIKWIKNFISDRSFQVRVNDSYSESIPATSGAPKEVFSHQFFLSSILP